MKEYEAQVYDVVTVLNVNDSENLKELELVEKEKYMVSYVFADGSCVLYKEKLFGRNEIAIYEHIIEEEDVKHLSRLYNYMDMEDFIDDYEYDEDGNYYITKDTIVDHDLNIGDYVYFEDVRKVKLYQEAGLKNNQPYQITAFSELNNCPFIMTDIGEFELYPVEVAYLKYYDGDAEKDIESKTNRVTDKESIEINSIMDKLAYDIAMDKALSENDINKAQQIYNLHNDIK